MSEYACNFVFGFFSLFSSANFFSDFFRIKHNLLSSKINVIYLYVKEDMTLNDCSIFNIPLRMNLSIEYKASVLKLS